MASQAKFAAFLQAAETELITQIRAKLGSGFMESQAEAYMRAYLPAAVQAGFAASDKVP